MLVKPVKRLVAFVGPPIIVLHIVSIFRNANNEVKAGDRLSRRLDDESTVRGTRQDPLALASEGFGAIDEDDSTADLYSEDDDEEEGEQDAFLGGNNNDVIAETNAVATDDTDDTYQSEEEDGA